MFINHRREVEIRREAEVKIACHNICDIIDEIGKWRSPSLEDILMQAGHYDKARVAKALTDNYKEYKN